MAIDGKQRKLDEALRAGVSGKKIDIDKLMASTTTTLLSCNIVFTPSSIPFNNPADEKNANITILGPKYEVKKDSNAKIGEKRTPKKCFARSNGKVRKSKDKRMNLIEERPKNKKKKRRRRRSHKKKAIA
ncbi:hypothetical protein Tcan_02619 [Toxocara canis]|uniref:Uncharacterized protein n=1 Tax=Toxocara canis TaxID=6265 RepID=A0A0B2W6J9_TOXCA|nr:hypothetical protein Tcan_02619 [Toxocara canis]